MRRSDEEKTGAHFVSVFLNTSGSGTVTKCSHSVRQVKLGVVGPMVGGVDGAAVNDGNGVGCCDTVGRSDTVGLADGRRVGAPVGLHDVKGPRSVVGSGVGPGVTVGATVGAVG